MPDILPLRDTQKRQTEDKRMQAQAEVDLEKVRAEAEEKRRAGELQAEEKKRANEIKLQIAKIEIEAAKEQARFEAEKEQAKIEADKELTLKGLELKAQQDQASSSLAATAPLVIKMPRPRSYHLL